MGAAHSDGRFVNVEADEAVFHGGGGVAGEPYLPGCSAGDSAAAGEAARAGVVFPAEGGRFAAGVNVAVVGEEGLINLAVAFAVDQVAFGRVSVGGRARGISDAGRATDQSCAAGFDADSVVWGQRLVAGGGAAWAERSAARADAAGGGIGSAGGTDGRKAIVAAGVDVAVNDEGVDRRREGAKLKGGCAAGGGAGDAEAVEPEGAVVERGAGRVSVEGRGGLAVGVEFKAGQAGV